MRIFNIDNGWNIKLPENWKEERDNVDGYHIYYPTDSDLTIIITTFHFFKNIENGWKVLSPVDDLSQIFNESIKKIELGNNTKVEENINPFNITDRLSNQADDIKLWYIKPEDSPELEESDIPGVYFNEFREYVDEEGNVLSPSEVDAIRYKDDYEDDYYR